MSYYYLSHKTVRYLMSHAKPNPTFHDVLSWMCSATEFDELPVRHNEDLINAELARNLPLSVESMGDLPLWDPHVKAFLLLQAYMSRIDLPISDYVGDQTSVLDQGIRIIQASIDIMAELGYLRACETLVSLLQSIKSARWPEDNALSILPGIEPTTKLQGLPGSLVSLSSLPTASVSGLAGKLQLPAQFTKAASYLPQVSVSVANVSSTGITVSLSRRNPPINREHRVYAPRFPKPQTEGYFLIVCSASADGKDGELLALKRVSWPANNKNQSSNSGSGSGSRQNSSGRNNHRNGPLTVRSSVKFPQDLLAQYTSATGKGVNVKVISDTYPGMLWMVSNVEVELKPETQSVPESSNYPEKA
jgi:antiviral helicase SLH1